MKEWNYAFSVPEQKKVRVLVHTDCKNEADDQYALARHVMTPKFIVKGVIASHFNMHPREYGDGHTAQASFDEVNKVLEYMGIDDILKLYFVFHSLHKNLRIHLFNDFDAFRKIVI